jgi:hypothetical protein
MESLGRARPIKKQRMLSWHGKRVLVFVPLAGEEKKKKDKADRGRHKLLWLYNKSKIRGKPQRSLHCVGHDVFTVAYHGGQGNEVKEHVLSVISLAAFEVIAARIGNSTPGI